MADGPSPPVQDGHLYLRPGEPAKHEQHAQARLHRRLGSRFDQIEDTACLRYAPSAPVERNVLLEVGARDEVPIQRHVDTHHRFDEREASSQVECRADR